MAYIGVRDRRADCTVVVRLYGPSSDDMKLNIIQLKNFVRAVTNKHSTADNDGASKLCKAIANETLSVYGSNSAIAWVGCDIETDNGYLYSEAAEFVEE
jgi:hypothetical protein